MARTVTLHVEGSNDMNAYVAMPQGKGPFPALIIFQEAFGVNHYIKNVAERFAAEGYVSIAPELFHRTAAPGFEARYYQMPLVLPHLQALSTDTLIADATAACNWLMKQPEVDKDKLGTVGFCLGGRASFLANASLKLAACVSFYAGHIKTVADRAPSVSAPHLFFWGGKDQHIKPEHVQAIVDAFRKENKDFANVEISYADHGFFCDERDAYHPLAAKEAWGITKEFLKNRLC